MNFLHGRNVAALAPKGTMLGAAAIAAIMVLWLPGYSLASQIAGRQIYEERCALCHGLQGKGWDWRTKAEKPPIPVPNLVKVVPDRSDAYLFKIIKFGGSSVGLTSFMPAFGFNMEDQQVWDLVAYLRTLPLATEAKPSSYLPSTPQSAWQGYRTVGQGLYEERYALRHGAEGQGWDWGIKVKEPPFPVPNLVEVVPGRSDDYLIRVIGDGDNAAGLTQFMPAFGFNMHEQQAWDVAAYLLNLSEPGPRIALSHLGHMGFPPRARRSALPRGLTSSATPHPWLRFAAMSPGSRGFTRRLGYSGQSDFRGLVPSSTELWKQNRWFQAHQGTTGNGGRNNPIGAPPCPGD